MNLCDQCAVGFDDRRFTNLYPFEHCQKCKGRACFSFPDDASAEFADTGTLIKKEMKGLAAELLALHEGKPADKCGCTTAKEIERHFCDDCAEYDCGRDCNCKCSKINFSDDPDDHAHECEYPKRGNWYIQRLIRLRQILDDMPEPEQVAS